MLKVAKWRTEKSKIKVVFRLQFQAIKVPSVGWESLLVSLVPSETGKPTTKTEKAVVQDGTCQWEAPIYETVKLSREGKTGKYDEKIYLFVVSTGSSKGGLLGQAAVNFADYADFIKPASVTLPLKALNSAYLQVIIQRLPALGGNREDDHNGDLHKSSRRTLWNQISDLGSEEDPWNPIYSPNVIDGGNSPAVTEPAQFSPSLIKTFTRYAEPNGTVRALKGYDAVSGSSSDSSGHDFPSEVKNNVHQNALSFLSAFNGHTKGTKVVENLHGAITGCKEPQDSNTECSLRWTKNDSRSSTNVYSKEINFDLKVNDSDVSIQNLQNEIEAMTRQADRTEMELQALRKQIVKENKKVQDLSKEVSSLKEERDAARKEQEQWKVQQNGSSNRSWNVNSDHMQAVSELKQELDYEKDLNANLRLQIQKIQDSNSELILAVQDLEELLQKKEREVAHFHASKHIIREKAENGHELPEEWDCLDSHPVRTNQEPREYNCKDHEQLELEILLKKNDQLENAHLLEHNITELQRELEDCKKDRDNMEMQMEQLALDYEILTQENHDMSSRLEQCQLQEQLKMQYDSSGTLAYINELETRIEELEKELERKGEAFEADIKALTHLQTEDKLRAIQAEELINKLETEIEVLKNKLAKQEEAFAADCATLNSCNEEQEQKLIQEEALVHELKTQLGNLKEELLKHEEAHEDDLQAEALINKLETEIEVLKNKLAKQEEDFAAISATLNGCNEDQKQKLVEAEALVHELETQIGNLEDELLKQEEAYEADLATLTQLKTQQQQRAIQAEELLTKTRSNNAKTAERLQEEFIRLSMQMSAAFDVNEKLAMQARKEATEVHLQKVQLEEFLRKSTDEFHLRTLEYQEHTRALSAQLDEKTCQAGQLLLDINVLSKELTIEKDSAEANNKMLSADIVRLTTDIQLLVLEKDSLRKKLEEQEKLQDEAGRMSRSISERDHLLQKQEAERRALEEKLVQAKEQADKLAEELKDTRHLIVDKEEAITSMQSEMEMMTLQHEKYKRSLVDDELEKEKLQKQVCSLKNDLKKKEDAIRNLEKKYNNGNSRPVILDGNGKVNTRNNKSGLGQKNALEIQQMQEELKLLKVDMTTKDAEFESKRSQFSAREMELNAKILELERSLRTCSCSHGTQGEDDTVDQNHKSQRNICMPSAEVDPLVQEGSESDSENQSTNSMVYSLGNGALSDCKADKIDASSLLSEIEHLKQKNIFMEEELKEMQERYSEISLKFAEVEGERQQLVMSVRYLRNARKN